MKLNKLNKFIGLIRLIRPINGLMMGVAVIVGASLALAEPFSSEVALDLFLGFLTAFSLTSASMAINDYYDYEIDKINEPDRPLPSGIIKRRESIVFSCILVLTGLVSSVLTNKFSFAPFAVAIISLLLSVIYATIGKKTGLLGNFLVSACVATPFVYGSFVVGKGLTSKIALFAALAFLSNTGREVTKGIVDAKGDKMKGVRTVMVIHGDKVASVVSSCFFLSATLLSLLPWHLKLVSVWYLPFVAIADTGFVISSIMLLHNPSRKKAKQIKNLILIWMLLGMISFFLGSI